MRNFFNLSVLHFLSQINTENLILEFVEEKEDEETAFVLYRHWINILYTNKMNN